MAAARLYTAALLQSDLPDAVTDSIVVTGHQPELFHVGVWAKNFALAGVARQTGSTPINLIIDNDTLNETSLNIPTGSRAAPAIERIPFDAPRSPMPWEEARILDQQLFQDFGTQARSRLQQAWGFEPLIGKAWDAALRGLKWSDRLCDALARLRVTTERSWGLANLELPMSRLCETDSFHWFVAHLFARLPELREIYNEAVARYRTAHRLRNRMQPVPDLDRAGEWLEAPFWIWQPQASQRGHVYARQIGSDCEIRDEHEVIARLPISRDGSLDRAVEILRKLPQRGYRLRTRALTTTLYARICLADVFVHGIGGAKYDAITDEICERFFGLQPPQFLTVSATLYLPLGGPYPADEAQLREVNHRIRDLAYNPDRHLGDTPEIHRWIAEKSELLMAARNLREANHSRGRLTHDQHQRLDEIRLKLLELSGPLRSSYEAERKSILGQLSANHLIRNREYSFALFPEQQVRDFLMPLAER